MWPGSQKVMGHHGWVSLILSQHSVHFSGEGPCGIGDIKLLICHVISCDHVMRGSCESMCEFPSSYNHCHVNFDDHTPTLQRKKYFIFNFSVKDATNTAGWNLLLASFKVLKKDLYFKVTFQFSLLLQN